MAEVFGHHLIEIESHTPGVFGGEPSPEIRSFIEKNGWPDRKTVQAARRRSEDLHRVVRDVSSFSIDPRRIVMAVRDAIGRRGL
jgi:hypothetical protein